MSDDMELVYNKYIADEKLKNGTKYERLAAVVYKTLDTENTVIHDLRLRGEGKLAVHQIDVTIEKDAGAKRILVECKDYQDVVGIGIIRDFHGAVSQIKPDEAIVVTTKGFTKGAVDFAQDEGIKLTILRKFEEDDWDNRIKTIIISMKAIFMGKPKISWVAKDENEQRRACDALKEHWGKTEETDTQTNYFYDSDGNIVSCLQEVLQPIFNFLPREEGSITKGRYEFDQVYYVMLCGVLIGVRGFDYEYFSHSMRTESVVDDGGKIAVLLFKMLDGSKDKILFDNHLEKWTFNDNGEVVEE